MTHRNDLNRDGNTKQSRKLSLSILAFCLFIALVVACTGNTTNSETACADICVDDIFAEFYYDNNLDTLFGEPYSGLVTIDVGTPMERDAQYFNGGRLELNAETGQPEIAALGEWAYEGLLDPIEAEVPISGSIQCFDVVTEESVEEICVQGAFLEFYLENNGALVFGLPLSQQLDEGDLRVQYFENVRLEWHPEAPTGQQIQVGLTGRAHYLYNVYEPRRIAIPVSTSLAAPIESVDVIAAVRAPILYKGDEQVIYILVETPERTPVSGVSIDLVITHNGETYTQVLDQDTSDTGTVSAIVELPNFTPEQDVQIEVFARDEEDRALGNTIITFQTWW